MTAKASLSSSKLGRKWWVIPLVPLALPILVLLIPLVGVVYIVAELGRRRRAWRIRNAMRNVGRISSWANVESDLASGGGTLIVDCPCFGWNDADIWWTRESIPNLAVSEGIPFPESELGAGDHAQFEARMKDPAFDGWCRSRYFDATHGTAKLVQCTHWRRDLLKSRKQIDMLKSNYPRLESVETHSGLVHLAVTDRV